MESFIRWIGGKRLLRKQIIAEFPKQYGRYVEVFGGAGWVLFEKEASRFEVYNDIDGELVNLFRCIKYHRKAVEEELKLTIMARETFFEYRDHEALTDIQRAARFYYLIKGSYGADLRSFSCQPCDIMASMECFPKVEERLRNVLIENKKL